MLVVVTCTLSALLCICTVELTMLYMGIFLTVLAKARFFILVFFQK